MSKIANIDREDMLLELPALQSDTRLLERRLSNPVHLDNSIRECLGSIQKRLDKLKKQANYKE